MLDKTVHSVAITVFKSTVSLFRSPKCITYDNWFEMKNYEVAGLLGSYHKFTSPYYNNRFRKKDMSINLWKFVSS